MKMTKIGIWNNKMKNNNIMTTIFVLFIKHVWLECSNENDQDWDLKQQNEK
jgi:hypothetical protein